MWPTVLSWWWAESLVVAADTTEGLYLPAGSTELSALLVYAIAYFNTWLAMQDDINCVFWSETALEKVDLKGELSHVMRQLGWASYSEKSCITYILVLLCAQTRKLNSL